MRARLRLLAVRDWHQTQPPTSRTAPTLSTSGPGTQAEGLSNPTVGLHPPHRLVRVSGRGPLIMAAPGAKDKHSDHPGPPRLDRAGHRLPLRRPTRARVSTRNRLHPKRRLTPPTAWPPPPSTPTLPALVTSAGQAGRRVVNSTDLPSSLYGGGGSDNLTDGSNQEDLERRNGCRLLSGMGGDDLLAAHDGASDQTIDCGHGTDKADLDLLPLDATSGAARQRRGTRRTRSYKGRRIGHWPEVVCESRRGPRKPPDCRSKGRGR